MSRWVAEHPEWKCHVPSCLSEREVCSWWCGDHRRVGVGSTFERCPECGQLPPGVRATQPTSADLATRYGFLNTEFHERINPCPVVQGRVDHDDATRDDREPPARAARRQTAGRGRA